MLCCLLRSFAICKFNNTIRVKFNNTIRVANSLDLDQTSALSRLIWVHSVCKKLSEDNTRRLIVKMSLGVSMSSITRKEIEFCTIWVGVNRKVQNTGEAMSFF